MCRYRDNDTWLDSTSPIPSCVAAFMTKGRTELKQSSPVLSPDDSFLPLLGILPIPYLVKSLWHLFSSPNQIFCHSLPRDGFTYLRLSLALHTHQGRARGQEPDKLLANSVLECLRELLCASCTTQSPDPQKHGKAMSFLGQIFLQCSKTALTFLACKHVTKDQKLS